MPRIKGTPYNAPVFKTLAKMLGDVNTSINGGRGGRRSQVRPGPVNERRRPIIQVPVAIASMAHPTLYPQPKAVTGRPLRLRDVQLKRG